MMEVMRRDDDRWMQSPGPMTNATRLLGWAIMAGIVPPGTATPRTTVETVEDVAIFPESVRHPRARAKEKVLEVREETNAEDSGRTHEARRVEARERTAEVARRVEENVKTREN